jgi:hypothetical protein
VLGRSEAKDAEARMKAVVAKRVMLFPKRVVFYAIGHQ